MALTILREKNWAATARPIAAYFVQDIVAENEGPHANEVSREEFVQWASANLTADISYDDDMHALFLCLDGLTSVGERVNAPD